MKRLFVLSAMYGSFFCAQAQVGKPFPTIQTLLLDETKISLPQSCKGRFTVVGMAYSKEAETDLSTWYQPVYETFLHKDKGGAFEVEEYELNLYFVPMFTGLNQAAHAKAVAEMKKGVDKNLWPHLLIYKGDLKPYKDALTMDHKEKPYFFVLDKEGKIVHTISGKYTEEKMAEIEKWIPTR